MSKKFFFRFMLWGYGLAVTFLFLYSYTQVDLALTLTKYNWLQYIQAAFQNIGFYRRDVSVGLYVGILGIWFALYWLSVTAVRSGTITKNGIWKIIWVISGGLLLSYPAFSYDIFNYMFTAKTVLVYHKNPYTVIPLDFSGFEPWLSFMRWTHQPSAYTPVWIAATLPFFLLGFGYFLPILWSIKCIAVASYIICIWLISRILDAVEPRETAVGMAIFALNPLVIIETLVSGHNDILMMAFALTAIFLMVRRKKFMSWIMLSLSAAVKLMTVFLLPIVLAYYRAQNKKWREWMLVSMTAGFIAVCLQREVLPWYWVWIMPFVALLPSKCYIFEMAVGISIGLLLRYAPYVLYGHWDPPVPVMKQWVTWIPIVTFGIYTLAHNAKKIRLRYMPRA